MPAEEEVLGRRAWRGAAWALERRGERPAGFGLLCPPSQQIKRTMSFWLPRDWQGSPSPSCFNMAFHLPAGTVTHLSTSCFLHCLSWWLPRRTSGSGVLHLQVSQTCCPSSSLNLLCSPMSWLYIHAFYTWPHTLYLKMQTWEVACVRGCNLRFIKRPVCR